MIVVLRPVLPPPSQPFSSTATLRMPCSLGQVVGGGEAVAAGADDDHVVGRAAAPASAIAPATRRRPRAWRIRL